MINDNDIFVVIRSQRMETGMMEIKNIAIIGLGLIGGSLAKAIAAYTDYHIGAE